MKNLMKILSVLILFCGIVSAASIIMDPRSVGEGLYEFSIKILAIFTNNIIFIVAMAICCYCLERNDDNYLTRIIPVYCMIPISITAILLFFKLSNDTSKFMLQAFNFFTSTSMWVLALSLILVIKPNNQISKIVHMAAYGAIAVNIILSLVVSAKTTMVEKLPNVYGSTKYGGFNFATVEETESLASTIYDVSVVVEIFAVLLLFTTNYAFSGTIELETENIDFEALKNEAEKLTKNQMTNKYSTTKKKRQSLSRANAKIEASNTEDNLESVIPTSSGPVKNETLSYANVENSTVQTNNNQNNQAQSIIAEPTYASTVAATPAPTPAPNKFLIDEQSNEQQPQNNQGKFF